MFSTSVRSHTSCLIGMTQWTCDKFCTGCNSRIIHSAELLLALPGASVIHWSVKSVYERESGTKELKVVVNRRSWSQETSLHVICGSLLGQFEITAPKSNFCGRGGERDYIVGSYPRSAAKVYFRELLRGERTVKREQCNCSSTENEQKKVSLKAHWRTVWINGGMAGTYQPTFLSATIVMTLASDCNRLQILKGVLSPQIGQGFGCSWEGMNEMRAKRMAW